MHRRLGFSLFATAIAASAAAHALVIATLSNIPIGTAAPPAEWAEMTVRDDGPQSRPAEETPEWEMGLPGAKGYATHDLPGHREQTAREAPQDQPSLSLDPEGDLMRLEMPSNPGDGQYTPPTPDAPAPPAAASAIPAFPSAPESAPAMSQQLMHERIASIAVPPAMAPPVPGVEDNVEVELAPAVLPSAVAKPARVAPAERSPVAPAAPARPVPGSGADPAPQSDSESDAFSVLGSADVRGGRVTVRSGRQVKTRRPHLGLAGMVELAKRDSASVELKVSVDPAGKVTDVDVARSSGSNDIDQPCRIAMYDWWFEPKKDAAGRAVPDVFKFTISFR